jgi:hypothetical protein
MGAMRFLLLGFFLWVSACFTQELDLSASLRIEEQVGDEICWSLQVLWKGRAGDVVVKPLYFDSSHPLSGSIALDSTSLSLEGVHGVLFRFRLDSDALNAIEGRLPPVTLTYLNLLKGGGENRLEVPGFEWSLPLGEPSPISRLHRWFGFTVLVLILGVLAWIAKRRLSMKAVCEVDEAGARDELIKAFYARHWQGFFARLHGLDVFPFKEMSREETREIENGLLFAKREPSRREIERLAKEVKCLEKLKPQSAEDEDLILESELEGKI